MRCPSCGAICKKRSMKCAECGAFRNRTWVDTEAASVCPPDSPVETAAIPQARRRAIPKPSTSLIEFPSPGRQPIPQWRKELGERVREVQEKRAREAILENGGAPSDLSTDESKAARPLELLTKPSAVPTNPLVVAALRRIERAYAPSQFAGNNAVATATAYAEQPAFDVAMPVVFPESIDEPAPVEASPEPEIAVRPEKTHNLSVVSAPVIAPEEIVEPQTEPEPKQRMAAVKPRRLIRDDDPALNYLDSLPTTVIVESHEMCSAPVYRRVLSAIFDFVVVGALAAPAVAMVKLTDLQWQDPRVVSFAAGTLVVAAFLYYTISTALTGRTFAMRLFKLRVVDARTGLIPTGTQSAGRAFFYILSLATACIGLIFAFIDRDKRTAHDRFTRTAVVRV